MGSSKTAKHLTPKVRADYVRRGGGSCPFCGYEDLQGGSYEGDGSQISQRITCLNPECGRSWWDVYRLVNVLKDT